MPLAEESALSCADRALENALLLIGADFRRGQAPTLHMGSLIRQ